MVPTPIQTQIMAILEEDPQANRVALVWPEPLSMLDVRVPIKERPVHVVYCPSELAMREALVNHDEAACLVLISKFDEVNLAKDVLARLWKNQPKHISPWRTLQQLVKVKEVDPRLLRNHGRWMATELLQGIDRFKHRITFGEVLDQESAWRALALAFLNYAEPVLDLGSLFKWSLSPTTPEMVKALPKPVRDNLREWLIPALGEFAPVVEHLLLSGQADAIWAVGLACSVMYPPQISSAKSMDAAQLHTGRGRFNERQFTGLNISSAVLARFGSEAEKAAQGLLQQMEFKAVNAAFGKAEQILASMDFLAAAHISPVLPGSYSLRLAEYAYALERAQKANDVTIAAAALHALKNHRLATRQSNREQLARADMALRLVAWLINKSDPFGEVSEYIRNYIEHTSFVDWARAKVWSGDVHEELNRVYLRLTERVSAERERQNAAFGQKLEALARGDNLVPTYTPVECALAQVVAPIAEQNPVLLLVLDGMSQAVYRELIEHLNAHSWIEVRATDSANESALIAAFPTVTEVSRCSLLSGALVSGTAADEKKAFAGHPHLKRLASTKFPPTLFHKQELVQPGSGSLNAEVWNMIAGTEYRILGAVINAIDDQLKSSSQVAVSWNLDTVKLLHQILEAARESGRVVVITSDHGHVLDHDSSYVGADNESGERYQSGNGRVGEFEVQLSGNRVVTPDQTAILPWSEKLRYTKSKNMGYHGGGSPQEVIIPLGVYKSAEDSSVLLEWTEFPRYFPEWWLLDVPESVGLYATTDPSRVTGNKATRQKAAVQEVMGDLFGEPALQPQQKTVSSTGQADWVQRLFDSPVYQQMQARAGRTAIQEQELRALLELLDRSNGQVMEAVVIRELAKPQIRLRGFLAGAQKLLNVEGYPILAVDRDSQTIRLNLADLKTQFEL